MNNHEPYPEFRCASCNKIELAYKTILLEDQKRACSGCYYEAIEKGAPPLMTTTELEDSRLREETFINNRNRYLSTLRKYSLHFGKPPLQVMEEFMRKEISIAETRFGTKRKNMTRTQLHTLTTYLKNLEIPNYFKETLTEEQLKNISPGEYYTHRDYEMKLKTMLRQE